MLVFKLFVCERFIGCAILYIVHAARDSYCDSAWRDFWDNNRQSKLKTTKETAKIKNALQMHYRNYIQKRITPPKDRKAENGGDRIK